MVAPRRQAVERRQAGVPRARHNLVRVADRKPASPALRPVADRNWARLAADRTPVAPEVLHRAPDGRADVFSLGAVLYTMLAGYGWTWGAELPASIEADAEMDDGLKTILLTAADGDPDKRYQSMQDLFAALAAYLESIWPGRSWT